MILRRINAVFSLLCTVMLMGHAIAMAIAMLSQGKILPSLGKLPWVMVGLMAAHAILSIVLAFLGHKGTEKRKCKEYSNLNMVTIIQRMSGMLLLVFTALHVAGAARLMKPPQVVHVIVPPLFFTLTLAHVAVSASKAFISLGIGNAKFIRVADIAIKLLCAVTLVANVVGFYLFAV